MMLHDEFPVIEFTAEARCDGCGAQAHMVAERDGQELQFCGNHSRKVMNKLLDEGWRLTWDNYDPESTENSYYLAPV
jgi:hypothetical protein